MDGAAVSDSAPVKWNFYNEKMELIRVLSFSDYKMFGEHLTPAVWRMKNIKDSKRETTVTILDAAFGVEIPEDEFTRSKLEKYP